MPDPSFLLLHVRNPATSERFYADLLGKAAVESSPNFAMFVLDSGVRLGLWATADVEPPATTPGGSEIAFAVDGETAVRETHARWIARGLAIPQPPTAMDFGWTFVALDPDGHRLRVFAPTPL